MRHAKQIGLGLIFAAVGVGLFAGIMLWRASAAVLDASLMLAGLLVPLGAQIAFGWWVLQQNDGNPND